MFVWCRVFSWGGGERGERERDGANYYEDDNYEVFVSKLVKLYQYIWIPFSCMKLNISTKKYAFLHTYIVLSPRINGIATLYTIL